MVCVHTDACISECASSRRYNRLMRIKGLDGLRAIAFFFVFAAHAGWVDFGWPAMQSFFVLSGFLITGILQEMKACLPLKPYLIKFYGRRFLRIFPVYYFYLLVIWLIIPYIIEAGFKANYLKEVQSQFVYAVTYTYELYMVSNHFELANNFLTHLWSLSMEEQFYILWPLLVFFVPRKSERNVFLSVIAFSILFRLGLFIAYAQGLAPDFLRPSAQHVLYVFPFSHLEAFALGALLTVVKIPRARLQFNILVIAVPALGLITDFAATGQWQNFSSLGYPLIMSHAAKPVWAYSVINYFWTVVVYGVAFEGWFLRLLEWPPARYLGKISYGLYVYHYALIWFVTIPFGIQAMPLSFTSAMLALGLDLIIASLSFRFMEKPISDLKDRYFGYVPVPAKIN